MTKLLISLPLLLIITFVFFSVIDRSDYALEKRAWSIDHQFEQLARDPNSIPEKRFNDLISRYKALIAQYPSSKSISRLYALLGNVYAVKGDLELSRSSYFEVLKRFPEQNVLCALSLTQIAGTYEKQNNERGVLITFHRAISDYPDTAEGLRAPLDIVNYELRWGHQQKAAIALQEAEDYYKKKVLRSRDPALRFYTTGFLARTCLAEKHWKDALKAFKSLLIDYGQSPYMNQGIAAVIVRSIDQISVEKLNDPALAISIYSDYLKKFPHHPLSIILIQKIRYLKPVPVTFSYFDNKSVMLYFA